MRVDLTLIGKAIDHLRDILNSILALEGTDDESKRGLGTDQDGKGEFYLSRVLALVPDGSRYIIFDRSAGALYETAVVITEEAISRRAEEMPSERLTVHFLTPTHIKEGGEWLKDLQFHQLYGTISRRVKSLMRRYCDESVDFRRWAGPAREVKTVDSTLAQASLPRYSASQEKRQTVDGMTGTVTFEGELDPFSPFLAAGEWVHAGKGCAVGLGKLSVGSKSHLPSIS
ncbi:MAG: CRISPR system precrRNA processing endoribonuclease RAMP protein Cas6 [Salinibacter sp.]